MRVFVAVRVIDSIVPGVVVYTVIPVDLLSMSNPVLSLKFTVNVSVSYVVPGLVTPSISNVSTLPRGSYVVANVNVATISLVIEIAIQLIPARPEALHTGDRGNLTVAGGWMVTLQLLGTTFSVMISIPYVTTDPFTKSPGVIVTARS